MFKLNSILSGKLNFLSFPALPTARREVNVNESINVYESALLCEMRPDMLEHDLIKNSSTTATLAAAAAASSSSPANGRSLAHQGLTGHHHHHQASSHASPSLAAVNFDSSVLDTFRPYITTGGGGSESTPTIEMDSGFQTSSSAASTAGMIQYQNYLYPTMVATSGPMFRLNHTSDEEMSVTSSSGGHNQSTSRQRQTPLASNSPLVHGNCSLRRTHPLDIVDQSYQTRVSWIENCSQTPSSSDPLALSSSTGNVIFCMAPGPDQTAHHHSHQAYLVTANGVDTLIATSSSSPPPACHDIPLHLMATSTANEDSHPYHNAHHSTELDDPRNGWIVNDHADPLQPCSSKQTSV